MFKNISPENPVVGWWSGGADSAIACKKIIEWFDASCCRIIFIDTHNEDPDTYRLMLDCEVWYGIKIETISAIPDKWESIWEIWEHFLSLNVATGAICSTELKRIVRQDFQMRNDFSYQAFGFDCGEIDRAHSMSTNYPDSKPIYPCIYELLHKGDSINLLQKAGIIPPVSYQMGYSNNNCGKTGCVKGGIGYWQKRKIDYPDQYDKMADFEHYLTNLKGKPVTICKDQSKGGGLVFLKPHPDYPHMKDLSMMKGRMAEPLMECNGFCGPKQ